MKATNRNITTYLLLIIVAMFMTVSGSASQSVVSIESTIDVQFSQDQIQQVAQPTSFVDKYVSTFLSDLPMENEENEEEEEELNEEEIRIKKVSVKDFYYTQLMCCRGLEFLSKSETHSDEIIFIEYYYPKFTECNYLLFQVFRI